MNMRLSAGSFPCTDDPVAWRLEEAQTITLATHTCLQLLITSYLMLWAFRIVWLRHGGVPRRWDTVHLGPVRKEVWGLTRISLVSRVRSSPCRSPKSRRPNFQHGSSSPGYARSTLTRATGGGGGTGRCSLGNELIAPPVSVSISAHS